MSYLRTLTQTLVFAISFSCYSQISLIETTQGAIVSYHPGHKQYLDHVARCFHNTLNFQKSLFGYTPSEKISVFIEDFGDFGNGGATSVPKNFISMGISPYSYAFETSPAGERFFATLNHEVVHVVALDNSTKADRFYQGMFMGKVQPNKEHPVSLFYGLLTTPRYFAPRWYHEGIAAYMETWMGGGRGLAMGSWDEMNFRTKVFEQAPIYSAKGLESEGTTTDFQGMSNAYLYGTRFMGYLAHEYGPNSIIDWVKRDEGSKGNYSGNFKKVFNKKIQMVWRDWISFENQFQEENLAKIRQNRVTKAKPLTTKTLGSVSYPHYDAENNKIYFAVGYPGQVAHIAEFDLATNKIKRLKDIPGAALFYVSSLAFDAEKQKLFYTIDNNTYRDLAEYDLNTGKSKVLQKDFRAGDLAVNKIDASIWGVRHSEGLSTLIRIPYSNSPNSSYTTWQQIYTLEYGHDIFDIDISPDGEKLSAAVSNIQGKQYLLIYDVASLLDDNDMKVDTVFNFDPASPQSFRFTPDGKYLFGSSYYSSVSNIFRVDMSNYPNLSADDIEAMSNAETGFFRPIVMDDETIFVLNFTTEGFQPSTIPNEVVNKTASINYLGSRTIEKHPALKDWELQIPGVNDIKMEDIVVEEKDYKPSEYMQLNYAFPTVVGYKDHVGIGYNLKFRDLFGLSELTIQFAYTPESWNNRLTKEGQYTVQLDDDETYHFSFDYQKFKLPRSTINIYGSWNEVSFYDLFGPSKISRKGISGGLGYQYSFLNSTIRKMELHSDLSGFFGLERSPDFQTITVTGFDNNFFLNFSNQLSYTNRRFSIGAVDYEKGIDTKLSVNVAHSAGTVYPNISAAINLGTSLPIKHTSIWFRNYAGHSFSNTINPFTRFGFAAFGNNYIDYRSSKQYRNTYALPGLQYDALESIISKSFFKSMVELSFPAIRFRELGFFNFFVNWLHPTIFSSVIFSDAGASKQTYGNLGVQVDMRMVVLSQQSATLSFGYAKAQNLDNNNSFDEWMISLKLLK